MINRSLYYHSRPTDPGEPSRSGNDSNEALTPASSGADGRLGNFLANCNRTPDVRGCINPGGSLGSSFQSSQRRDSADGNLGKISPPNSRSGADDESIDFFPSESGRSESFVQFSPSRNDDVANKQLGTFMSQEISVPESDDCAPSRAEIRSPRKAKTPSKKQRSDKTQDAAKSLKRFVADNAIPFGGASRGSDSSNSDRHSFPESSESSAPVEYISSDETDAFSTGSGYYSLPEEADWGRRVSRTDSSSLNPPSQPKRSSSDNSQSSHHHKVTEVITSGSPESFSDTSGPAKSSSSSSRTTASKGLPSTPTKRGERVRLANRRSFSPASSSRHSLGSTTSHTLIGQKFIASSHHDDASMVYSETSVAMEPSFHDSESSMPSLTSMSRRSSPRSTTTSGTTTSGTMPSLAGFSPRSSALSSCSSYSLGVSNSSSASVSASSTSSSSDTTKSSRSSSVSSKSRRSKSNKHGQAKPESYDGALLMMVDKMHGSGSSLDFYDSVKSLQTEYSKTSSSSEPGLLQQAQRKITTIIDDRAHTIREPVRSLTYVSSASTTGTSTSDEGVRYVSLQSEKKQSNKGSLKKKNPRRKDSHGNASSGELMSIDETKKTTSTKKQDWQSLLSNHLQHKRTAAPKDFNESRTSGTLHSSISTKTNDGFLDASNRSMASTRSVEETKEIMDRLDGSIRSGGRDGSIRSAGRRLCQSASPIRPRLRMDDLTKMRSSAPSPRLDRVRSARRRHQLLSKHQRTVSVSNVNASPVTERLSISKLIEELSISNLEEELSVSNSGTTTLPPLPPPSPPSTSSRKSVVPSGLPPVDPKARTVRMSNRSIFNDKKKKRRSSSRSRPLTNTPLTQSPVLPSGTLASLPSLPFGSSSSSSSYSDTSSSSSHQSSAWRHSTSSHLSISSAATGVIPLPSPRRSSQRSAASSSGSSVSSSGSSRRSGRSSSRSRRSDRSSSRSPKREKKGQSPKQRASSHSPKRATSKSKARRESSGSCASSTSYTLAPIKLQIPDTPRSDDDDGDSAPEHSIIPVSPCSSNHATISSLHLDVSPDESVARHARSPQRERTKKPSLMPVLELSPGRRSTGTDSIWRRLEEEKRRQQKLRARLFESRETQSSTRNPPRSTTVTAF